MTRNELRQKLVAMRLNPYTGEKLPDGCNVVQVPSRLKPGQSANRCKAIIADLEKIYGKVDWTR